MDRLARDGSVGLMNTVGIGITPGSGPGHFGLFGYYPLETPYRKRGVLAGGGTGLSLTEQDVAARGNFCTVNQDGFITDRRGGRIPTEECARMVSLIDDITFPGVEVIVKPVLDYPFVLNIKRP